MAECIVAEFNTQAGARLALEVLERNRYTVDHVSVVSSAGGLHASAPGEAIRSDVEAEIPSLAPQPEGRTVGLGMLLGGTVATPLAMGTMIGPFLLVGPLVGMGLGAAFGALLSSERSEDASEEVISYKDRIDAGSILIVVTEDHDIGLNEAEELLATTNPASMQRFELKPASGEAKSH